MLDFKSQYNKYLEEFNIELDKFCNSLKCEPTILNDSLIYSLQIGGKRIRPVLMLAVADLFQIEHHDIMKFALAIELIHTYSLIHDDLPDIDNDDFRRGKPSNHKVFGNANAILAGDGLLNTAYSILFEECSKGVNYISAAKMICDYAGIYGMIAGQSADILHEHTKSYDKETLHFIYDNKTAKLLTAPIIVPSVIMNGKYFSELKAFGKNIGTLFQVVDDILDVEGDFDKLGKSIGKDQQEEKLTCISVYGLQESKVMADMICDTCYKLLDGIDADTNFLSDLVDFVRYRGY